MSTYKRPEMIKRAIKSVLSQTYTDWELIIVDDRSKDNTKDVVESFKDPRIHYIEISRHFGCDTKPKNEGIKASKGEYIAFLDDDNEFRPDHLAILLKEFEKDPTLSLVYGDRWIVDDKGVIPPQLGMTSDFDPLTLMTRNFIDTSDVLVKRQALFDVGGFDERFNKYVDWNVYVRMLKMGKKFKRVPTIITNYHLHEDMKSLKVRTKHDAPGVFIPEWDAYNCEIELPYLGKEVKEPKVAIYSITYDRIEYTKKSFKSLKETAGYPFDHFIVDNGSTDETRSFLVDYVPPERRLIHGENQGISRASNQVVDMIKEKDYDIIVKWDNDCIGLTKGWLLKMVDIWKSNRMMALSCYVQGLVDNPGGAQRIGYGTLKGELVGIAKHLGGICHFVDAHAYDVFRWDEDSFLHGVQDMEFSQYLQFHGFSMGYLENYYVSHGPVNTAKQKDDYPEYFERRIKEKQTRYEEHGK
jgi:glycosyltransferase involved in cell wall biosynthesis